MRITSGSTYKLPGSYDEELLGNTKVRMGSWHSEIQPTGLVEAPPSRFGQNYPRNAIEKRDVMYIFQRRRCSTMARKYFR